MSKERYRAATKKVQYQPGMSWAELAAAEGHKRKFPKQAAPIRTESETDKQILAAIAEGPIGTAALQVRVGANHKSVSNAVYRLRSAGEVHSTYKGRHVVWHLGPRK